jgi:hypothetical protein
LPQGVWVPEWSDGFQSVRLRADSSLRMQHVLPLAIAMLAQAVNAVILVLRLIVVSLE